MRKKCYSNGEKEEVVVKTPYTKEKPTNQFTEYLIFSQQPTAQIFLCFVNDLTLDEQIRQLFRTQPVLDCIDDYRRVHSVQVNKLDFVDIRRCTLLAFLDHHSSLGI